MAKKLNLEDKPMPETTEGTKPKIKSKTILNVIVLVVISLYEITRSALAPQMGWNLPEIPTFIYTALTAAGLYTARTATTKVV